MMVDFEENIFSFEKYNIFTVCGTAEKKTEPHVLMVVDDVLR